MNKEDIKNKALSVKKLVTTFILKLNLESFVMVEKFIIFYHLPPAYQTCNLSLVHRQSVALYILWLPCCSPCIGTPVCHASIPHP